MSIEDRQSEIISAYNALCIATMIYPPFDISDDYHQSMLQLLSDFANAYEDNEETSEQEQNCLDEMSYLCKELMEEFVSCLQNGHDVYSYDIVFKDDHSKEIVHFLQDTCMKYEIYEIVLTSLCTSDPLSFDCLNDWYIEVLDIQDCRLTSINIVLDDGTHLTNQV